VLLANSILDTVIVGNHFLVGGKCITFGSGNNFTVFTNNNCDGSALSGTVGTSSAVYGNDGAPIPYVNGGTNATTLAGAQANFEMPKVIASATGVNFNSVADTALAFTMPTGYTRVSLDYVTISNASHTLTTAQFGVFTATAAGGVAFVASGTGITVSATADQTANNTQATNGIATIGAIAASLATPNTIYFRVTQVESATATGDVTAVLRLMP